MTALAPSRCVWGGASAPRAALLGLALVLGCDGLGRPVVDNWGKVGGPSRICTQRTPGCDDEEGAPDELQTGAQAGLPACRLGAEASLARITTNLRNCSLSLSLDDGEEREIVGASLNNVSIELDSRVQLHIADSTLFGVTLTSSRVQPDQPAFVHMTHSDLGSSEIAVEQLEMVSCFLWNVAIDSGTLSGIDLETRNSVLFAKVVLLSASRFDQTHVGHCATLLIAGSHAERSRFDACDGVSRIYDVEASACTFDGELESDRSTFVDGRFGARGPTQLHAWGTSIDNTILCPDFASMRASGGGLTCVACQGPLAESDPDMCIDTIAPSANANFCEALIDPPTCDEFPRHNRPIVNP
jgi:hypothetical protein